MPPAADARVMSPGAGPRALMPAAEAWPCVILLVAAMALGGASAGAPIRDMIVQLAAIGALAWIAIRPRPDAPGPGALPVAILFGLLALFAVQLVPLPFDLWAALPGRETAAEIARLSGTDGPHPISLDPERTIRSGLALLPGVAMFLVALRLDRRGRMAMYALIVAGALASLVLGGLQFAGIGGDARALTLFDTSHAGQPVGLFANANHQAALMLVAFVMAGSLALASDRIGRKWWLYAVMAMLAVAVVLSGSRMGILLLPIAFVGMALRKRFPAAAAVAAGLLAIAVVAVTLFHRSPVFAAHLQEIRNLDDTRLAYWPDILYAIDIFGWSGSGMGTFDTVYQSVEDLNDVTPNYLNHAHNDYLEIALEAGAFGILLLLAFLFTIGRAAASIVGRRGGDPLAYGALLCILLLMLHSLVDYPLRTALLSTLFGFCCALVLRPRAPAARRE